MRYDVRAVGERREARLKQGAGPLGPIAELLVEAIDKLRTEGSPKALQHAIALSSSAIRMGCGKRLSSLTELLVAHGSLEAISKHMMLQLIFGHDVEGALAERCLDQLDARRDERKWEYNQNWFQWEDLLVLMIFGRGVLNNNHSQGHIGPQADWISEASGRFKKACPEAFEGFVQS
jgi:hypothetical protein